ncbi:hypothetical protein HDV06_005278 [Boothiomyces sp. JEL0866]|nr:hypothetical protein HDV06_005278 [Boothiomyces sp. JEL0866]
MTIINKIPAPLSENHASVWHSLSLPDNHIRLTINFEYHLLDLSKEEGEQHQESRSAENPKKYYITYILGGSVEGKTDILTAGEAVWTITHDIHVTTELLMNLYQKPSEFIIWEISSIMKDIKRKVIIKENLQNSKSTKDEKQGSSKKPPEKKILKMSLANTGVTNKLQLQKKKKTLGKTIQKGNANSSRNIKSPKTDVNIDLLEAYLQGGATLPRTSSFDEKKFTTDATSGKRRPGSASPVLSRRSSAISSAGRVSPHPHHYNHPEKHVDPNLIKSGMIRSRSSSFSNLMDAVRPKTPPSPHHHVHPLKVLQSAKVDKKKLEHRASIKKESTIKSAKSVKSVKSARIEESSKRKSPKENLSTVVEYEPRITWSSTPPSANAKSNWEKLFQNSEYRKNNDFPVEKLHDNNLIEKKKGENIHIQIEKVKLDLGMLFFDQMELNKGSFISNTYLNPMVHDRDFRTVKDSENELEKFLESGRIQSDLNPKSPYGYSKFDLSSLLEGSQELDITTSILPSAKISDSMAIQQGNWLGASAELTIKCELKFPMTEKYDVNSVQFEYAIVVLPSNDITAAERIVALNTEVNASELNITVSSLEETNLSLKMHTLTADQLQQKDLLLTYQLPMYEGNSAPFPSRNMTLALLSSKYTTSETFQDSFLCGAEMDSKQSDSAVSNDEDNNLKSLRGTEDTCKHSKVRDPYQFYNRKQMTILTTRKLREPNFVKLNARRNYSYEASYTCSYSTKVFNYSCQKKSSVEMQLEKLREDLQRDEKYYFTYGKNFLSQMINQSESCEDALGEKKAKAKWMTKNGFYSGPFKLTTLPLK